MTAGRDDQRVAGSARDRLIDRLTEWSSERGPIPLSDHAGDVRVLLGVVEDLRAELAETRAAEEVLDDVLGSLLRELAPIPWALHEDATVARDRWDSVRGSVPVPAPDRAGDDERRPDHATYQEAGRSLVCKCGATFDTWHGTRKAREEWEHHARASGGVTAEQDEPEPPCREDEGGLGIPCMLGQGHHGSHVGEHRPGPGEHDALGYTLRVVWPIPADAAAPAVDPAAPDPADVQLRRLRTALGASGGASFPAMLGMIAWDRAELARLQATPAVDTGAPDRETALLRYFAPDDPTEEPILPAAVAFKAGWDSAVAAAPDPLRVAGDEVASACLDLEGAAAYFEPGSMGRAIRTVLAALFERTAAGADMAAALAEIDERFRAGAPKQEAIERGAGAAQRWAEVTR